MAASVAGSILCILLYALALHYFIQSIVSGGVKQKASH